MTGRCCGSSMAWRSARRPAANDPRRRARPVAPGAAAPGQAGYSSRYASMQAQRHVRACCPSGEAVCDAAPRMWDAAARGPVDARQPVPRRVARMWPVAGSAARRARLVRCECRAVPRISVCLRVIALLREKRPPGRAHPPTRTPRGRFSRAGPQGNGPATGQSGAGRVSHRLPRHARQLSPARPPALPRAVARAVHAPCARQRSSRLRR